MAHLTAPEAKTASSRIRLFADAHKPYQNAQIEGDGEYKMLDIVIPNDGTPCTPRIKKLITEKLGEGWQLVSWWRPEPLDEF